MKIDSKFIEHWEPKYDEIESDENEYLSLIERINVEVKNNNDYVLSSENVMVVELRQA
jgi:hypothetical protein